MAATPGPIVPVTEPSEKISNEGAVEDVMDKYESLKRDSAETREKPCDELFVWPEGQRPDIAHDHFDFELQVIDLSPVLKLQSLRRETEQLETMTRTRSGLKAEIEACEAAKSDILKGIRAACEERGFFQIINSGFPMEVADEIKKSCQEIFDLPLEEKLKVKDETALARAPKTGYLPMLRKPALSRLLPSYTWSEVVSMESPETKNPGRMDEIANILWPGGPESNLKGHSLRSIAEKYGEQSHRVVSMVLDLIAESLGMPAEALNGLLGSRDQLHGRIQVNNYPVCEHHELTWGLPSHTDPDIVTLLHQDEVGGLQIRFKDGTWHGVKPRPGALIVNCGDYLQAWTNGRCLSAEHRVVTNQKTKRMSIAYFALGDMNQVIHSPPACVDATHPLRYKPFRPIDYVMKMMSDGLSRERGDLLDKAFGIQR